MTLEVLAGDFKGDTELVDIVLDADPDVFAHNLETVPRLSRQVRVQASYPRSYKILEHARKRGAVTKTGLMLGLGETRDEVDEVLREVAALGVDIVTLGQYLSPSKQHLAIERYVHPTRVRRARASTRATSASRTSSPGRSCARAITPMVRRSSSASSAPPRACRRSPSGDRRRA